MSEKTTEICHMTGTQPEATLEPAREDTTTTAESTTLNASSTALVQHTSNFGSNTPVEEECGTSADPERAERCRFFELDSASLQWHWRWVQVQVAPQPFSKGSVRRAFNIIVPENKVQNRRLVAKDFIFQNQAPQLHFQCVFWQAVAETFARLFNSLGVPKPVQFVLAGVLELSDRKSKPLYTVESFIQGDYLKHNNNCGYVSKDKRNTPQAFSHFTYEASGGTMLICDLQGVGDTYTDPQIHTVDGSGFGQGNLGQIGIDMFFTTHKCNSICHYLGLKETSSKYGDSGLGTTPNSPVLSTERWDEVIKGDLLFPDHCEPPSEWRRQRDSEQHQELLCRGCCLL